MIVHWIKAFPFDFNDDKMRFSVVYFNQVIEQRPGFQAINRKLSALLETLQNSKAEEKDDTIASPTDSGPESPDSASSAFTTFDVPNIDDSGSSTSGSVRSVSRSASTIFKKAFRISLAPDLFSEPTNSAFLDLDAQVLVNQLCLLDSQIYQRIQPRDFVESYLKKGKKRLRNAQTVSDNISFFNRVSAWVAATILKEPQAKNRVKCIEKFIQMALVTSFLIVLVECQMTDSI